MGELVLDDLRKVYGSGDEGVVAVEGLDLTIEDGEFLVLVGPSGCGKSTTLRSVAGLEDVTSGEIRLAGRDITRAKPKRRNIAMVFQNYALYPHMSARENMGFGLRMREDMGADEIRERVEEAAEIMGITDLLDKRPGDLSGGQQQRVALGRAIVRDPDVFLLDEPLSNLDAKLRTQMRAELERLQDDLGVTTIYVTHDQTEAMTMGDRIAVLDAGELQQVGTPLECYYEPANQFVAEFIGSPSMNFFDVRLEGDRLVGDAFEYAVSDDVRRTCADVEDLVLGVRPEDFVPSDGTASNAIPATVDVIQPTGDDAYVTALVGDREVTLSLAPRYVFELEAGQRVDLTVDETSIYLFDGATGRSLKPNQSMNRTTPPPSS